MNNGEPEGLSRSYYPNGQLKAEVELRRGKIVKRRYWDEAGKVAAPQANPVLAQQGARAQKRARAAVANFGGAGTGARTFLSPWDLPTRARRTRMSALLPEGVSRRYNQSY